MAAMPPLEREYFCRMMTFVYREQLLGKVGSQDMVYNFLPFIIYPIYNTLQKLDKSCVEAAQDLGANPMQVFFKAVLPLSIDVYKRQLQTCASAVY